MVVWQWAGQADGWDEQSFSHDGIVVHTLSYKVLLLQSTACASRCLVVTIPCLLYQVSVTPTENG